VPSLSLYLALLLVSVAMIALAFGIGKPDWPGLLMNLASGLIGAVIILIFVDQRLRASEVKAIQDYASTSSVRLASLFSPEMRASISYAAVISRQLRRIKPEPYLVRAGPEGLLDKNTGGFILYGDAGSGKSTSIQVIAARQAEKALRRPTKESVPIFLRVHRWNEGDLSEQLWEEARTFTRVRRPTVHKWLAQGRALLILDGIDEHRQPEFALEQLSTLRKRFPRAALVVTSRTLLLARLPEAFKNLNLPIIEIPKLTAKEI
jgi:predicted NACHT family NTPase